MHPNEYKLMLLKESKKIDEILKNNNKFEKIILDITETDIEKSSLKLINQLGLLKKENNGFIKEEEKIVELLYLYLGSKKVDSLYQKLKLSSNLSLDDLQRQLNELVGLEAVKNQVDDLIVFNKIQRLREEAGLKKSNKTLHMAFLGNPGTAKTTVARIVGKMYKSLGLLSKGHFIEVSRTDLIAEYQGQTAIKVKKLINRAKGGVLFIDEAYSITENEKSDSYGKESLTELTKALEDYRDDLVVIVAGYSDLMNKFFDSNPGLKSRFNTFINFEDYSLDELVQIFKFICNENEYETSEESLCRVHDWLEYELAKKNKGFSNGRFIRNLFDDVIINQSKRLVNLKNNISKEELVNIIDLDIPSLPYNWTKDTQENLSSEELK